MNSLSPISTYRSVNTQSAIVDSNPHQLVLMLLDGAIEKSAAAIGHMRRQAITEKARLIRGSMEIIDTLRANLDHDSGGEIAGNLEQLYDYMYRRLMEANLRNDPDRLTEVISLLKEIRSAWDAIPQDYRTMSRSAGGRLSVVQL